MALALDDLLTSFASSSFAVQPQPEKDLRASLASCFTLPSQSSSGSRWAVPSAAQRSSSPSRGWTSSNGMDGWGGSCGTGSAGHMGGAWSQRGAPPNSPMGTPVRDSGFLPMINDPSASASVAPTGFLYSPPPTPLPLTTPEAHYRCAVSPIDCTACDYTQTLPPDSPASAWPLHHQHNPRCSLYEALAPPLARVPQRQGGEPASYLPSPSPSPGASPAGGMMDVGSGWQGMHQNFAEVEDVRM